MLNHTARSRLIAIYDLDDRLDRRIEAMTRWCAEIEAAVEARGVEIPAGARDRRARIAPLKVWSRNGAQSRPSGRRVMPGEPRQ